MALKHKTHNRAPVAVIQRQSQQTASAQNEREQLAHPANVLQRHPAALRPADILALQRTVGNRVVQRMLSSAKVIQRLEEDRLLEKPSLGRRETGLPDNLKAGIESLSGISLDGVKVHYNSAKPAALNARAFTQGADIYLGPKEEEHLPHEAWHVVQQRQGRVQPTIILAKGLPANDDAALEREADVMGSQAVRMSTTLSPGRDQQLLNKRTPPIAHFTTAQPIQRVEDTLDKKMELWSWLERHLRTEGAAEVRDSTGHKGVIPQWRKPTYDAFWKLVETKLEPTIKKVVTAQMALNSFQVYMLRPTPAKATIQLDALVNSVPEIDKAPKIKTTDDATKLADLKNLINWVAKPANNKWVKPLKAGLKSKRAGFTAAEKWQVYGEAIISEQQSETKDERWKVNATNVAKAIKEASVAPALDKWLDAVIARTKNLNKLWEDGTKPITGTFGSIPRKTLQTLFRDYSPMTRARRYR